MDEALLAMRKASRKVSKNRCAACELEDEMDLEHRGLFRRSFGTPGINSAGRRWWVEQHYPDARLLTLQAPDQCLRLHERHINESDD